MPNVTARQLALQLERLEDAVFKKNEIPTRWEDFVSGCYIRSGSKLKQMVPYPYQRALNQLMDRYSNITVVKTRQLGVTQAYISRFIQKAALNPAFTALSFMPTIDDVSGISKRCGEMLAQNRWGLSAEADNVKHIKITNGGSLYFRGTGGKSGARGTDSVVAVANDELAFCPNAEATMGAALASTALSGDSAAIISLSTPDVSSGLFYDLLQAGSNNKIEELCDDVRHHRRFTFNIPGFYHQPSHDGKTAIVVIHHSAHPIYAAMGRQQFLEYRQKIEKVPWGTILREYDLSFNSYGANYFNASVIHQAAKLSPLSPRPSHDRLWQYYCGIDPATGGEDYCTAIVLRRHTITKESEMVAMYRENGRDSYYYMENLRTLLALWKPAVTCIETNGAGAVFRDSLSQTMMNLDFIGFTSGPRSKVKLYAQLAYQFDAGLLSIWQNSVVERELISLKDYGGGRIRAPNGRDSHDDASSAIAFAVQAFSHDL